MEPNELRRLAKEIENQWQTGDDSDATANYLRACADALENGPVAWLTSPHGVIQANPAYHYSAPQTLTWRIPLYPLVMPAPSNTKYSAE